MAIKGKKKSRGSQGVRRPAAAPRPVVTGTRRHTPWYRTRDGMFIVGILALVAIGIVVWLVGSAREDARTLEQEQQILEDYTADVRGPLQNANPPATEMAAVTAETSGEDLEGLASDAEGWITSFQEAQTQLTQVFPAPPADSVQQLFNEALGLYISAAQTMALLPDIEGAARDEVFTRATVQRDTANALFQSAISVLDGFRSEKELRASGLSAPGGSGPMADPAAGASPGFEVEVPTEDDGSGGGGGGKSGGKKDGKDQNGGG
jgi:hypothetical protein